MRGAGCGGGAAASVAYQPPGPRLAHSRGTHRPARVVLRGRSVLPSRDDDARKMMMHGARLVELGGAVERRAHARRLLDRAERRAALVEQQLSTPPRRASAARHRFYEAGLCRQRVARTSARVFCGVEGWGNEARQRTTSDAPGRSSRGRQSRRGGAPQGHPRRNGRRRRRAATARERHTGEGRGSCQFARSLSR